MLYYNIKTHGTLQLPMLQLHWRLYHSFKPRLFYIKKQLIYEKYILRELIIFLINRNIKINFFFNYVKCIEKIKISHNMIIGNNY